ncbi:zinc-dependent alcohol dehydrogenase [Aquipuribacter sp. MA13-6]|uniref:zinc-dependent alcohol dehydrogenase n=1 Tax=unclassified Aquipuribacter TaxID=2635084 RepID=UPI003EE98E98
MRAFVVTAPGEAGVQEVPDPVAGPGEVVVDVTRVGVCGTDVEFFTGEMAYLASGQARYPIRLGHEWCGVVTEVGEGVDPAWLGRRVTGDTMLGCGRCHRCTSGRQHVCARREEVGIRNGRPGALAERLAVPATSLQPLPDTVDDVAGALVEPGANAVRAVRGAALRPGGRLLVVGPGTIGLLVALVARAEGADVRLLGLDEPSLAFARSLGFETSGSRTEVLGPGRRGVGPDALGTGHDAGVAAGFDAVVDASTGPDVPAWAVDVVEPGGRVVLVGIATAPSLLDTRSLLLADVTAVGVLSGSGGLADAVAHYASGAVDPRPLVSATVGLDDVADVLAGRRPAGAGPGPKVHVDPRR